jgi:hypothetical protein
MEEITASQGFVYEKNLITPSQASVLTAVILATWEAEIGRISVPGQPEQNTS